MLEHSNDKRKGHVMGLYRSLTCGVTIAGVLGCFFFATFVFSLNPFYPLALESQALPLDVKMETLQVQPRSACPISLDEEASLQAVLTLKEKWKHSDQLVCRLKEELFDRIYLYHPRHSKLKLTASMTKKVLAWLGGKTELLPSLYNQLVIYVMNKWTYSSTIYNILRGKRPKKAQASSSVMSDRQYVDKVVEDMRPVCDFCRYENETAADSFGRIVGEYTYTAANVFKLEEWHSLVVFKEHHPLKVPYKALVEAFDTVQKWFSKAHEVTPGSIYPMIFWETMGHAGASQPHPHLHPFLARDGYYGYLRKWQDIANDYREETGGRNYFSDLIDLHNELGLAIISGKAAVFAPLNQKKDFEFVIIAEDINEDVIKLLYYIFRAYIEDLEKYCFSIGIALPTMDKTVPGLPFILRIVTRGSASSVHADVTSMELFSTSLVETDPYKAIRALRTSVEKRKSLTS